MDLEHERRIVGGQQRAEALPGASRGPGQVQVEAQRVDAELLAGAALARAEVVVHVEGRHEVEDRPAEVLDSRVPPIGDHVRVTHVQTERHALGADALHEPLSVSGFADSVSGPG